MRKWIACALLIVPLLFPVGSAAFAEEADPMEDVLAPYCIVVDQNDPTLVLYERGADERCIPGSTMKIMTCILALEMCDDLDRTVTVSGQAASLKATNSLMGLMRGETLTIRQLLYGLMLESGNDAALQLAVEIGGDVEQFAELMNQKAAALGMTNTHFLNASGAYKSGQYSTARDMAILACYAMQDERFRTIVSAAAYTIEPNNVRKEELHMINGNRLIADSPDTDVFYAYATGIKTGSTAQGGKCLAASASKDGNGVVCIMIGATEGGSKNRRMTAVFRDAKRMMDLALTTRYTEISLAQLGLRYAVNAHVHNGVQSSVPVAPRSLDEVRVNLLDLVADDVIRHPETVKTVCTIDHLTAPVPVDTRCGSVTFRYHGRDLASVDLYTTQAVDALPPVELLLKQTPSASEPVSSQAEAPSTLPRLAVAAACILIAVALTVCIALLLRKMKKRREQNPLSQ